MASRNKRRWLYHSKRLWHVTQVTLDRQRAIDGSCRQPLPVLARIFTTVDTWTQADWGINRANF